MFFEHKFWRQMASIGRAAGTPIQKARGFLKLSRRAKALGDRFMSVGFMKHANGEHDKSRRFWSAASSMLFLSKTAREHARSALRGENRPPSFDAAPPRLAVPPWERDIRTASPFEEVTEDGS